MASPKDCDRQAPDGFVVHDLTYASAAMAHIVRCFEETSFDGENADAAEWRIEPRCDQRDLSAIQHDDARIRRGEGRDYGRNE